MMKMNLQLFASTYHEEETKSGSTSKTVTNNAAGKVDALTQQKFDQYKQGYKESQKVQDAYKYLQDVLSQKPGEFQSDYKGALDDLYNQVMGREKFSYDMNADVLYQQYKDMYMKSGQKAMQDTLGQASALTGGYANSYAQTAAQQTYQDYLGSLNDKVPELYQMAYDRYKQEGDELYQKFSMASDLYGRDYGEYRDSVSDWQSDRDYASGAYQDERNFDYNDFQTMLDFYQTEYWNQRHAVSESTTNTESWSKSSGSSYSDSGSSGSGGGSSSSASKSSTSKSSTSKSNKTENNTSGIYQSVLNTLKKQGNSAAGLLPYNEYQKNQKLTNQYGSGINDYYDWLRYMSGM